MKILIVFGLCICTVIAQDLCNSGVEQSPINIDLLTTRRERNIRVNFVNFGHTVRHITAINNGYSLELDVSHGEQRVTLSQAEKVDTYKVQTVLFHYPKTGVIGGSEHTINNQTFATEVQLIAYNMRYPSFTEANDHEDGLLAIGIMSNVIGTCNPFHLALRKMAQNVVEVGTEYKNTRLMNLMSFLPRVTQVATYKGSMTHPPCREGVQWIVLLRQSRICMPLLEALQDLKHTNNRIKLSRPAQPIHDRLVYVSRARHIVL